jgi:hypothetical protein
MLTIYRQYNGLKGACRHHPGISTGRLHPGDHTGGDEASLFKADGAMS